MTKLSLHRVHSQLISPLLKLTLILGLYVNLPNNCIGQCVDGPPAQGYLSSLAVGQSFTMPANCSSTTLSSIELYRISSGLMEDVTFELHIGESISR